MLNALEKLRAIRLSGSPTVSLEEVSPLTEAAFDAIETPAERTERTKHYAQTERAKQGSVSDPVVSAVLKVLVQAERPVLHSQIVKALAAQGYSKRAAYVAIAWCQGQGWIAHNLVTGYELICPVPAELIGGAEKATQ